MKRYIEHVKTKDPHERRAHAMRIAGALTAVVFVGWLGTLGVRLATSENVAQEGTASQAASVISGFIPPSQGLQVASTSYTGY
jgi:hypothetical protein